LRTFDFADEEEEFFIPSLSSSFRFGPLNGVQKALRALPSFSSLASWLRVAWSTAENAGTLELPVDMAVVRSFSFDSRVDTLGKFSFPSPSLDLEAGTMAVESMLSLLLASFCRSFPVGEAEVSLEMSVFLRSELPMLILLLSEIAFRFRLVVFVAAEAAAAEALVVLDDDDSLDPRFALLAVASLSLIVSSSPTFDEYFNALLLVLGDKGWLAPPSSLFVVVSAAFAWAGAFEAATSAIDVDATSSFLEMLAFDLFVDDAVAALLLLWLDFLEAGRKLVRLFFVDFDPRGINETPGSGMLLLSLRNEAVASSFGKSEA
jgi:hypothetical protein